jgi:iron(III) transport system permease protein
MPPGRGQSHLLLAGGFGGAIALLATGFAIGAKGWSFAWLEQAFGAFGGQQFGMGWGAAIALVALTVLGAFGIARRGLFRGDLFVAAAVVLCGSLLALFIVFPVSRALAGAFVGEDGHAGIASFAQRIASERNFGLQCLAGGVRCGVAWNTLFLGIAAAASTTLLGTLLALMAERGPRRYARPLNVLALLPIITPPFVVGWASSCCSAVPGLVNQLLESTLGLAPSRWFYGGFGVWVAQTFAFTPIAFMIMRGVVQGIAPSLEEAAQTLRADADRTFATITLPLLRPGLANAFLVGFIESMAGLRQSHRAGRTVLGAVDRDLLCHRRRAIRPGPRGLAGLAAHAVRAGRVRLAAPRAGAPQLHHRGRQGRFRACRWRCPRASGAWCRASHALARIHAGGLPVRLRRRLRADLGARLHAHAGALPHRLLLEWGAFGLVWAGTAWNSFFTTVKLAAIAAPLTAASGLLVAWLLARTSFRGQGLFEFSALLAFAIPGTVLGVSYILAFNVPPFELTGTALIIVLCFVFRNLPVGVRAGTAAFQQIDKSLDEAR